MIPILSTILIACTSSNSITCDTPVNQDQSSLIVAENIVDESKNEPLTTTDPNLASQTAIEHPNPIPVEVEMPPETTAKSLGTPIQLNYDNSSTWNQSERILIAKNRQGDNLSVKFALDSQKFEIVQETPETNVNNTETDVNNNPQSLNVVEVLADQQEYLDQEQIIKATGNVVIRFSNGVLVADQVLINLVDRVAVAQNNVNLQRGEQVLRGDRFEYYFVEDKGVIYNAQGEIYQPSLSKDVQFDNNNPIQKQPLTSQFEFNQPLRRVVSQDGYTFVVGSFRSSTILQQEGRGQTISQKGGGKVNRFRFQAEKVNFDSDGWQATNIRITNDPFSPPEFEIRADSANLAKTDEFEDELVTTNSRLVFDQNFSIPIFRNRLVFNRRDRNPGLFNIGFDGDDLGGFYLEREFDIYSSDRALFTLTPQFLVQRAFFPDAFFDDNRSDSGDNGGLLEGSSYALVANFEYDVSERSRFKAVANFTGLDFDNIDRRLRANAQFNHKIGDLSRPYNLNIGYNYRERLFNGSLGFRTVQESFGGVIVSPIIPLGNSPFSFQYQGSIQNIRAVSDREELLKPNRRDDLVNLTRFQAGASLTGSFTLWSGEPLPATAEEGLRYTSTPVVPYLILNTGLRAVGSYYSNGDNQPNLTATIGLEGQFGHFSRPYFDYTAFNVSFSQAITGDQSPFLFDRFVDKQLLSVGFTQQLYGPLRVGLQAFYNIDTSEEISTDYFIEYSRRTYNVILRYNPVLEIGSFNLRISDFNWEGNSTPFEGGTGIKPVVDGMTINNE